MTQAVTLTALGLSMMPVLALGVSSRPINDLQKTAVYVLVTPLVVALIVVECLVHIAACIVLGNSGMYMSYRLPK